MESIKRSYFHDPWDIFFSGFGTVTSATLLHHLTDWNGWHATKWSDCSFDFMMNQKQCHKSDSPRSATGIRRWAMVGSVAIDRQSAEKPAKNARPKHLTALSNVTHELQKLVKTCTLSASFLQRVLQRSARRKYLLRETLPSLVFVLAF